MRVSYSCTFEFQEKAPLTHRGTVEGAQPSTCVARAVRSAQKALRPINWTSVVAVLDRGVPADSEPSDV